ncbi:hypothetical protein PGTUg99_001667 [Puccinia graminis f. sp. tritici]|uniref:BZIP domain-containing protein n=1 Tax=Puccinia graminis f. sp. tritici TaxID=56615 RepID=A0A5B0NBX9_PUCGR|nr:hypothetical protein PGTUg99_001667 [Puccinia graminis f. sp. tritici]
MKAFFNLPWLMLLQKINKSASMWPPAPVGSGEEEFLDLLSVHWQLGQENHIHDYLSKPLYFSEDPALQFKFPDEVTNPSINQQGSQTHPELTFEGGTSSTRALSPTRDLHYKGDYTVTGEQTSGEGLTFNGGPTISSSTISYHNDGHAPRGGSTLGHNSLTSNGEFTSNDKHLILPSKRKADRLVSEMDEDRSLWQRKRRAFRKSQLRVSSAQRAKSGVSKESDSKSNRSGSGSSNDFARKNLQLRKSPDQNRMSDVVQAVPHRRASKPELCPRFRYRIIGESLLSLSDEQIDFKEYPVFSDGMEKLEAELKRWKRAKENQVIRNRHRTVERITNLKKNVTKISTFLIISLLSRLDGHNNALTNKSKLEEILTFMETFWQERKAGEEILEAEDFRWISTLPDILNPDDRINSDTTYRGYALWFITAEEVTKYWMKRNMKLFQSSKIFKMNDGKYDEEKVNHQIKIIIDQSRKNK